MWQPDPQCGKWRPDPHERRPPRGSPGSARRVSRREPARRANDLPLPVVPGSRRLLPARRPGRPRHGERCRRAAFRRSDPARLPSQARPVAAAGRPRRAGRLVRLRRRGSRSARGDGPRRFHGAVLGLDPGSRCPPDPGVRSGARPRSLRRPIPPDDRGWRHARSGRRVVRAGGDRGRRPRRLSRARDRQGARPARSAMTESASTATVEVVAPSRFVRRSVISVFIGLGITFLTTFGVPIEWRLRVLAYGGLGGFLINTWCHILARAFSGWLARHAQGSRLVFAGVYFLGGLLGLATASVIAVAASLMPFSTIRSFFPLIALSSSAAAVVVGLVFYTFGLMENRLRDSVERLKEHEFAEKELQLAREIQKCLLPPQEMEGDGWRLAARNVPALFVAGDFYDVFRLSDGALGVVVADVAGKGMA